MTDKKKKDEGTEEHPEEAVVAGVSAPHVKRVDSGATSQPILPPSGAPEPSGVKVKEVATGRVFVTNKVDGRELVTHPLGEHVYADADEPITNPGGVFGSPMPAVAPQDSTSPTEADLSLMESGPPPVINAGVESLDDMSKSELQALARRARLPDTGTKAELVASLQTHVEAGTVALKGPPALKNP